MTRLVGIIGTDGSGKTTLSAALVEALTEAGVEARHEWLGAESYLMAPVRSALKLAWRRRGSKSSSKADGPIEGGTSGAGYRAEISRKNAVVRRFPWAVRAYVALVLLDYRLQLRRKLSRGGRSDLVVADRYVFDVAVNLGLVLGWGPDEVVRFLQRQLTRVRLPDVRVFLRVEPEVSLERKDDIPDIDYLRLRLTYYDAVARAFGFEVRDGTRPLAETAEWLVNHVRSELTRPHIHYVHSNNVDVGGADKVLVRMAQHMGPRNPSRPGDFRVSVSLRLPTAAASLHERAGTPVLLRDFERPQVSAGIRGLARFAVQGPRTYLYFSRLFALQSPDLVHVNDVYDFVPALAAHRKGIPVVAHLRMFAGRSAMRKVLSKLIGRTADASIAVSEAVRRHYFPTSPVGHRAEMIHDLGDAGLMSDQGDVLEKGSLPDGLPPAQRLVVMVGRIEEWKGQSVFLDAVELLPAQVRSQATFALVGGEVPGKEAYFEAIASRAARARVVCLGVRNDVPQILRAADVSVHCSTQPDPFPGVVIESLLAGAATVGARDGGVSEMIQGGDVGILTAPGDARELAQALCELLTSAPSPRERFAERARARGLELVDPDPIDQEVADLYKTVLTIRGADA